MFGLFRKEDPNLKRNHEALQLRELQQVWKRISSLMASHYALSRNAFLGYFFFVTATVQMSGVDSFKEPFTLLRLLALRRFHAS